VKIGIDFDNTIVSYDKLFFDVASGLNIIPNNISKTKISVRDYLRKKNQNDIWTSIQGIVYGEKMMEAEIYPGFIDFIKSFQEKKIDFCIISHKTQYPFVGKKIDLHNCARNWIKKFLYNESSQLIQDKNIFFEISKELKIERISSENCDVFIDDLPEILLMKIFPDSTKKILFDPNSSYSDGELKSFSSWSGIKKELLKNVF
tara:strand:- start:196 stop:804 length:609 start_codon:yes stop_codon:yes gene_type:complete